MRILMLTNEYPPNIYGGAGVHVEHLSREILQLEDGVKRLDIHCFGDQEQAGEKGSVRGAAGPDARLSGLRHPKLLDALYRNLSMVGAADDADLIHCHTWYTYLAGCLLKQIQAIPLVATIHSLEPHRPWKKEQLGNAYYATSWLEKTALEGADGVIAVSEAMKKDVSRLYSVNEDKIRVIYNGIDKDRFRKVERPDIPASYGIDPDKPYVLFVGRITRQKGILHLVRALPMLDRGVQAVLCAGAPDTAEIGREMETRVKDARGRTKNEILWIPETIPVHDLAALYSHAAVFVCPSVYEPFGIINLEAMACATPVVAAAVGGIPEVVAHDQTGLLVPFEPGPGPEPKDPEKFAADLAGSINLLLRHPEKRNRMGIAARKRVEERFAWDRIAGLTVSYYKELAALCGRERRSA
ncbi:MAG: glycogen synthase [Desulfobacterales bacterium]|nr:glycogen synthase [Desulfobacterales bacterium]